MSRRHNLVEFQENLTRRLHNAPQRETVNALLAVALGAESWLIKLTDIAEVLSCPPIESVPWTKPWFRGATNFRGQVYGVVDLAAFVGAESLADTHSARLLLLNRNVARGCALLVGKVLGMRNPAAFRPAPQAVDSRSWVKTRVLDDESAVWLELDLRELTTAQQFIDVTN